MPRRVGQSQRNRGSDSARGGRPRADSGGTMNALSADMRRRLLALVFVVLALGVGLAYPLAVRFDEFLGCTFEYPWVLLALVVIPVFFWRTTWGEDGRSVRLRLGSTRALSQGPRGIRVWIRDLPGIIRSVALALLIVALARP